VPWWCPCIQRRSREGEEWSTATSSSVVDLPKALVSFDGGFASVARWKGLLSEREWSGEEWATGEGFQRGLELYTVRVDSV
jgi:hypothetical protein